MSIEMKLFLVIAAFVGLIFLVLVYWRLPKRLRRTRFAERWKKLQECLKQKDNWREAVITADKMLDEALRKRKFKGGSMGERMVSAQRYFTDNDDLWFAHNLSKKLKADENMTLREADVRDALFGFRQALRDIGALDSGDNRNS